MPVRGDRFVPRDCAKCPLHEGRTQVVPAEGGGTARVFVVGEAPGPDEDEQGRPFIGRAGRILRRSLAAAGWSEEDVWITNAVKCFPHEMVGGKAKIRKPTPQETEACRGHLAAEVATMRPRLVIALGKTAAEAVTGERIAKLGDRRGFGARLDRRLGDAPTFVTFHPSGLHYGHATEAEFVDDLRRARAGVAP